MRYKVAVIRQGELDWWPRESAEILGRHFVGSVSQDGVVQLDDRRRILGRETRSGPLLALGLNSGAELTTQSCLYKLDKGLAGKREWWRSAGQQPKHSLA